MSFPFYPLSSTVKITDYAPNWSIPEHLGEIGTLVDIEHEDYDGAERYMVDLGRGRDTVWVKSVELVDDTAKVVETMVAPNTVKSSDIKAYASTTDEAFAIAGFLSSIAITIDWSN